MASYVVHAFRLFIRRADNVETPTGRTTIVGHRLNPSPSQNHQLELELYDDSAI
jgi:hypothetical protein